LPGSRITKYDSPGGNPPSTPVLIPLLPSPPSPPPVPPALVDPAPSASRSFVAASWWRGTCQSRPTFGAPAWPGRRPDTAGVVAGMLPQGCSPPHVRFLVAEVLEHRVRSSQDTLRRVCFRWPSRGLPPRRLSAWPGECVVTLPADPADLPRGQRPAALIAPVQATIDEHRGFRRFPRHGSLRLVTPSAAPRPRTGTTTHRAPPRRRRRRGRAPTRRPRC